MTRPSNMPTWPPQGPTSGQSRAHRWQSAIGRTWRRGPVGKAVIIFSLPFLCFTVCCAASLVWAATPAGQAYLRDLHATETVQAFYDASARATATAAAPHHPTPGATNAATAAPSPTDTPTPAQTATSTPVPT